MRLRGAIRDWFGRAKSSEKLSDDELRAALRRQVMSDLSRQGALDPEYRADIRSEEDFEVRTAEMPLIAVWNEHKTDTGLAFSMSVNTDRVAAAIERYILREDPWFRDVHRRLVDDLRTVSFSSLIATVEKTGDPPSRICAALTKSR